MKVGKAMQQVLDDLEDLGVSSRKVLNCLKKFKEEMILENKKNKKEDITLTTEINKLLFDGRFDIDSPTQELLMYINNLKKQYGAGVIYYGLVDILDNYYYKNNNVHDMTDTDKCRYIMYFLKQNLDKYMRDYIEINQVYYDDNLTGDDFVGYKEAE